MNCENTLCIYCHNFKCTIDSISIDGHGMCLECIYPTFEDSVLQKAKNKTLKLFEKQHKSWDK